MWTENEAPEKEMYINIHRMRASEYKEFIALFRNVSENHLIKYFHRVIEVKSIKICIHFLHICFSFELDAVLIARRRLVAIAGPTVGDQGSNLVIVHLEMEQRPALFFQGRRLPHFREIESERRELHRWNLFIRNQGKKVMFSAFE